MAAPPNSQWVEYYDGLLMQLFTGKEPGLAIVFGSGSAAGALLDTTNMMTAFGRTGLGFAVLNAGIDLSLDKLRALIHAAASFSPIEGTADKVEVIALYFAGHGGSDPNNKPYIELAYSETVTVDEILSPFTCNKYKNARKLFFFDVCCQADSCKSVDLPARPNSLVAVATDSRSSGDYKDGGFWTRHLCKYITEDMDIFSMLTLTRQKTIESAADVVGRYHAGEIQEPCFAACMDHFNLKRLRKTSRSIEVDGNTAGAGLSVSQAAPLNRHSESIATDDYYNIDKTMLLKEPQLRDLVTWLSDIQNQWRRLGELLNLSDTELETIQYDTDRPKPIGKLSEVFSQWRKTDCSPYTFENLLDCLKKIKEAANCIKTVVENLKETKTIQEYQTEPTYRKY